METTRGIIVRSQSGFFTIDTEDGGQLVARLRGRLKKGSRTGDLVAVGDWVNVSIQEDGTAMVEEVEERESKFSRLAPVERGEYEQIIIANLDQVILTFSCADPDPNFKMLDRFLIIAEEQRIPAVMVVNKTDLIGLWKARRMFRHYAKLGYEIIYTSAKKKNGIRKLQRALQGKISVLVGPSGVGKSSLLNAVQTDLGLHVREVSQSTGKGRHTTVVRQMFPLEKGGYVADTPGLKALALWDIDAEEVDGYFPEIAPLVALCEYSNCSHIEEENCAVIDAVERGKVHPERYESYIRIRDGQEVEY